METLLVLLSNIIVIIIIIIIIIIAIIAIIVLDYNKLLDWIDYHYVLFIWMEKQVSCAGLECPVLSGSTGHLV